MKCEKFENILQSYLDGAAKPSDKAFFEKHLSECNACAEELRALKKIKTLLSALDRQKAAVGLESRVCAKIKKINPPVNPLESFIAAAKTTLAAAALIFCIITAFGFFAFPNTAGTNADNVEAINNYVLKGNAFAKQDNISDEKIIEALLG